MTRKPRQLAALAIVALISAGCGSNAPSETGTATGSNKKATARDKAVKFAECIRAHGVSDFPDPDAKNQFQYGVSVSPAVWKSNPQVLEGWVRILALQGTTRAAPTPRPPQATDGRRAT